MVCVVMPDVLDYFLPCILLDVTVASQQMVIVFFQAIAELASR
jgi:hypothetical protein